MDAPGLSPPTPAEIDRYSSWWASLSDSWKQAFNEILLMRTSIGDLPLEVLHQLWNAPALRFAGPTAPYPNMSFELDNLDGVLLFPKLEIFVFTHHKLKRLDGLRYLTQLQSLFVFNNDIHSLEGVEFLTNLQELYFQVNQVSSLLPIENLTQLHTIYCGDNLLTSLEGLGLQHSRLKQFFCLPNAELPQAEVIRVERDLGIRCRGF